MWQIVLFFLLVVIAVLGMLTAWWMGSLFATQHTRESLADSVEDYALGGALNANSEYRRGLFDAVCVVRGEPLLPREDVSRLKPRTPLSEYAVPVDREVELQDRTTFDDDGVHRRRGRDG